MLQLCSQPDWLQSKLTQFMKIDLLTCFKTESSAGALAESEQIAQVIYTCCSNSTAVLVLDKFKLYTVLAVVSFTKIT